MLWLYYAGHGAASASTGGRVLLGVDVMSDPAVFAGRSLTLTELRQHVPTKAIKAQFLFRVFGVESLWCDCGAWMTMHAIETGLPATPRA